MARAYDKRPVEHTLLVRRGVQAAFLLLNLWLGVQFYFWVRHFETGGQSAYVSRPPGVEGWLPIAALMNLKYAVVRRRARRPSGGDVPAGGVRRDRRGVP